MIDDHLKYQATFPPFVRPPASLLFATSAYLVPHGDSLCCLGGSGSQALAYSIGDPALLTILEIFVFKRRLDEAFELFREAASSNGLETASRLIDRIEGGQGVNLARSAWVLGLDVFQLRLSINEHVSMFDLSSTSRATPLLLRAVLHRIRPYAMSSVDPSREAFEAGLRILQEWGLIAPTRGHVDWGDLRRVQPLCRNFGFGRGTPIDRYYLERFIREIRPQVTGNTLEIGGAVSNGTVFGFSGAVEYHALDLHPSPYNDIVGDAHDPSVVRPDSFDSIICFNVLEHCEKPWVVVENMHRWLRKGGRVFCMVPNAQRVHELPRDYWRPLPSGIDSMFKMFTYKKLYVFGNLVTCTASFYGIACEELQAVELDLVHPDYPVATCIIAEK